MKKVVSRTLLFFVTSVLLNTAGPGNAQEGSTRTRTVVSADGNGRKVTLVERYLARAAGSPVATVVGEGQVRSRAAVGVKAAGTKPRPQFSGPGVTISSVAFGNSTIRGQSVAMTLSFNASSGPLTLAMAVGQEFTLGSSTCNSPCSVQVTFTPQYPGLRDDAVTATNSSGTVVAETFVAGTGVGPLLGYELGYDTNYSSSYSGFQQPFGITLGPDRMSYITDAAGKMVYQFNRYNPDSYPQALGITGLGRPTGVAVDGNNTVYVADQTNNSIVTYTATGVQGTVRTSSLSGPTSVAVDGTGAVYIADTGNNRVIKIDNQGAETSLASGLNAPSAVTVDSLGNVYYADLGSGGEVVELPAGGGSAIPRGTSIGTPQALAVDAAGTVYVGTTTALIVKRGGADNFSDYGTDGPTGVAVAPNGDLYTTQATLGEFNITDRSTGNFVVQTSVGGTTQGGLTISNEGNASLNLSMLTTSENVYTIDSVSVCMAGTQLATGATCNVTVDYSPVTPGVDTQMFTAYSNSLNTEAANAFTLYGSAGNTTTTETVSTSSASAGQPVTLTAIVNNDTGDENTPTGTVVFQDSAVSGATIGMATLGPAQGPVTMAMAQLTTSALAVGTHTISAVYQGSDTLATSSSDAQTVTVVAGAAATTTSLAVSATNVNAGAAETLTATIQAGASPGVTGTVTFYDQNGALGSGAVTATSTGGTASLTITFLSVGSHQIYGLYNGDGSYAPSMTGTQTVVVAQASTTTLLTLSAATISAGQAETLTVTVSGAGSPPVTGTATFYQGVPSSPATTLGSATVTATSMGGTASLTVSSLPVGNDPVYASYSGDTNYQSSVAGTQTVTVTAAAMGTTTTLTVDRASVVYRTPIALTATVVNASGAAATVGQVIFCDAAAAHCSAELSLATAQVNANGVAVARMPAGIVGSHSFTATFLGTGELLRSVSAPLTVTVTMQSPYSTYTTISSTGSAGSYGLTGSVTGLLTRASSPGGTVTFNDTTNANGPVVLGTGTLGTAVLGFVAAQPIGSPNAVGSGAYGVATGDLNGDGYPDVVVENYNAGTVSVLLGKGNGEFQAQVTYAVGNQPERVLVADFNGDGKLDLVVANSGSGTVGILLGNGDGTFQPQVTYGTSGTPVGLGVMDVNHDGIADIVAGNYYQNTVGVLLGNGDGTFRTVVTYATGSTPQTLAEGDFNGDGNVDLAVGNLGSNTVGILLGNGDGTFQPQVTYPVGPQPQGVQVGDFNGDGNDDLAVTNSGGSGTVSVLLGNGDGTFQPQVAYAVGADPVGLVIADFNGDGFQDISVGNTAQSALTQSILLGNGDGTFQTQKVFKTGNFPYGEAVADFNGDGFPDLAIANFNDGTATILLSEVTQTATASISGVSLGSPSGTHTVTASYGGDANFSGSVSPAISLMSSTPAQAATATVLTVVPGTQTVGLGVAFSVSVSGAAPTGTVTLVNVATNPAAVLGRIVLGSGGSGAFSTASLAVGMYSVVASYGGDGANLGSMSAAQGLTVTQAATATGLGVSAASVTVGQAETLTATITGNGMVGATGTVTFADQNGVLGSGVVAAGSNGGTAALTVTSLAVGAHRITASYGGDANDTASVSATQTVTVNAVVTTTVLQVSAAAISAGQTETLSAMVSGSGAGALAGTVTFSDQSNVLGSGTIVGGGATLALTTLSVGTHRITASYGGSGNYGTSVSGAQSVVVSLVAQTITFPAIANHSVGDAAFSLNATASSGLAVTYAVVSGPATVTGASVTVTGVGTVVIQATQAGNATYAAATAVTQSFTVVAAAVPVIAAVSPATAVIGASATTVTLTGTNFAARDVVQLNGATIGSTFVSATTLMATIPAAFLGAAGTGQLTVVDAASGTSSGTAAFVVIAKPAVTFTGPSTSASGQQPAVTVQLVNPYPAALTGMLTLAFAPTSSMGIDDPAVQFASGGRTLTFTVPANSTVTPAVQLQTGTVAGTATITLGLVSNGLNVTPANAAPVVIAIAAAVPAVTTATLTRSGSALTVVVHGFSNTREVATATFHFTAATGSTVSTPDLTVAVAPVFAAWYGSTASTQYGSSFTYTQQFTLDADVSTVGSVTVMLVNSVGSSVSASAQ